MLLDRRMVDLTDSVEKAPLGNEMVAMAEGLEASNALGNCRVADKENLGFGSLLGKFVAFSSFLGLPMMEFEKEINPVLKKLETRRGLGVKIVGGKKKSPLATQSEREIIKLERSVNYGCSQLSARGGGGAAESMLPLFEVVLLFCSLMAGVEIQMASRVSYVSCHSLGVYFGVGGAFSNGLSR